MRLCTPLPIAALLLLPACDGGTASAPVHALPDAAPDAAPEDAIPPDLAISDDFGPDLAVDDRDLGQFGPDSGQNHPDLGPDGGMTLDAAPDRALDAAPDAQPDVAPDATPDMAPDAAPDAMPDGPPPPPREQCFGGVDDDGDGLIDCADPECRPSIACFDAREDCANGVDDDGDLRADCDDRHCIDDDRCPPPDVEPYTIAELQARFDVECAECHGPVDPFSNLDLSAPFEDAVVDVLSAQVPMPLVKPGDRAQSFLYLKITFRHIPAGGDGEGMPPAFEGYDPWSGADAERLGRWIDGLGTN